MRQTIISTLDLLVQNRANGDCAGQLRFLGILEIESNDLFSYHLLLFHGLDY